MKLSEVYKELDESLNNVMMEFWKKYPQEFWEKQPSNNGVGCSGSVLYGNWHVQRNGFDGLKFHFTNEQISKFVQDGHFQVTESMMINQKKFEDES